MPEPLGTRFGLVADRYHQLRPPTPPAAIDWLTTGVTDMVVELGAGNGMVTEQLIERGLRVHAVEPDPRMRSALGERCPGALVLDGSAERIPHPEASVHTVLAGSAWHWFDPVEATREIARVLRVGGTLGVVWNLKDDAEPWVVRLDEIMGRRRRPGRDAGDFVVPAGAPFTTPTEFVVSWTWPMSVTDLVDSMNTYSFVLAMSEGERAARFAEAWEFVDSHPALAGRSVVDVPIRTVCYRTTRLPGDYGFRSLAS
ncbi:MAG TPA: class I SAM-dependent methyltransferase [Pseudonocardiaceae bacterium]|jgi:SAM-dependent methyltransferase|nr:class I SAM-dependent methyltransferase [Pseudonocardiaceae bacterium]